MRISESDIIQTNEEKAVEQAKAQLAAVHASGANVEADIVAAHARLEAARHDVVAATREVAEKTGAAGYQNTRAQNARIAIEKAEQVMHEYFRSDYGKAVAEERRFRARSAAVAKGTAA